MKHLSQDCGGKNERTPIRCPFCGKSFSPVRAEKGASAFGLWARCKNPKCRKEFEIIIEN